MVVANRLIEVESRERETRLSHLKDMISKSGELDERRRRRESKVVDCVWTERKTIMRKGQKREQGPRIVVEKNNKKQNGKTAKKPKTTEPSSISLFIAFVFFSKIRIFRGEEGCVHVLLYSSVLILQSKKRLKKTNPSYGPCLVRDTGRGLKGKKLSFFFFFFCLFGLEYRQIIKQ